MHGGLFAPLLPALAPRYRVHVVDLPGHGWSAPLAGAATLPALAARIDRRDSPTIDTPLTVLGWSLGGQVALQWALARPERVRRLVLVATTPCFVARDGWPHAMAAATLARFGDELRVAYRLTLQRFLSLQVQGSDEGRRTLAQLRERLFERGEPSREALEATLALLREADLRPMLARIATPALVVAGERDALVPLAATRRLPRRCRARRIARSRVPRMRRSCRIRRRFSRRSTRSPMAEPQISGARSARRRSARPCAAGSRARPRRTTRRRCCSAKSARRMAQRLDYVKLAPAAILDAGCGTGEAVGELGLRYPGAHGARVRHRAADGRAARRARTHAALAAAPAACSRCNGARRAAAAFVCADINALPFAGVCVGSRLEQSRAAMGERPAARDSPSSGAC